MKTFKQIDVGIQVALIIVFFVASLVNRGNTLVVGYFVVGAWQVVSMIVHELSNCFTEIATKRYYYHRVTLCIILIMLAGLVVPFFLCIFLPLLFVAPLMACYYTRICYVEVFYKMKRPLALLK